MFPDKRFRAHFRQFKAPCRTNSPARMLFGYHDRRVGRAAGQVPIDAANEASLLLRSAISVAYPLVAMIRLNWLR